MRLALGLAFLVLGCSGISALADDDGAIPLGQVPKAARQAAEQAVPGLKLMKAFKTLDEGATVYEVAGEDAKGREIEVEVTPDGRILSVSVEVELRAVPRVVMQALRAQMKGFRPTDAWAVWVEKKLVAYGFEGKDAKGEVVEVTVTADGSKVEIEDDDD